MTKTIAAQTSAPADFVEKATVSATFSVNADGEYYIGWHFNTAMQLEAGAFNIYYIELKGKVRRRRTCCRNRRNGYSSCQRRPFGSCCIYCTDKDSGRHSIVEPIKDRGVPWRTVCQDFRQSDTGCCPELHRYQCS